MSEQRTSGPWAANDEQRRNVVRGPSDDKMEMVVLAHPKDVLRFLNLQATTSMIAVASIALNIVTVRAILNELEHPVIATLVIVVGGLLSLVPLSFMNYKSVSAKIYAGTKYCKFAPTRKPEWEAGP